MLITHWLKEFSQKKLRHSFRIGAKKTPFSQKRLNLTVGRTYNQKDTDIWKYRVASLLKMPLLYLDSRVLNPLAPIESKVMNISIVGLPEARPFKIDYFDICDWWIENNLRSGWLNEVRQVNWPITTVRLITAFAL